MHTIYIHKYNETLRSAIRVKQLSCCDKKLLYVSLCFALNDLYRLSHGLESNLRIIEWAI